MYRTAMAPQRRTNAADARTPRALLLPKLAARTGHFTAALGRVRALAVASLERSAQLPDVPTVAQTLPGYEVTSFAGVVAPRGTPRPVIDRLNRELRAVLDLPDIRRQFTDLGGDVKASTPEAMMQQVTDEIAKWKRVVDARKIEIQ